MEIINKEYKWSGYLSNRKITDYIILHHAAATNCSPDGIHTIHLKNGWAGIGYHFYIRKNGKIYKGRPLNTIGAHAVGYNDKSIGVCFEGNFENEVMNDAQLNSARYIINYLKNIYPNAKVIRHRDVNATACPGRNFPYASLMNENVSEDDSMKEEIYNLVSSCPKWSQPYVQKAWDLGWIKGDGNGNLNLNDEKIFTLVIMLRALNIME